MCYEAVQKVPARRYIRQCLAAVRCSSLRLWQEQVRCASLPQMPHLLGALATSSRMRHAETCLQSKGGLGRTLIYAPLHSARCLRGPLHIAYTAPSMQTGA
jgi:hypothetical protein